MRHSLKCHQPFFDAIMYGKKNFEVRKNDRDFQVGDIVTLREYTYQEDNYWQETGRMLSRSVMYILRDTDFPDGLKPGYCVLGF